MRARVLALGSLLCLSIVVACGGDDEAPGADSSDGGSDAAVDRSTSTDGGAPETGVDAGPPPIRCTDAELAALDLTDGGTLEVTFELGANPKQYTNRCATVKAGASVTFRGSFLQHPLEPAGGDTPNPIPYIAQNQPDNRLVVALPSPGTFGYQCEFHPTLMFGAIRVVP